MHEYLTMGHILIVAVNPFHAWKIRRQRKNKKNAAPVNLIMGFLFYEYAVIVIAWLALQYGISCNVMGIHIHLSIYLYRSVAVVLNNFYFFIKIISFNTKYKFDGTMHRSTNIQCNWISIFLNLKTTCGFYIYLCAYQIISSMNSIAMNFMWLDGK